MEAQAILHRVVSEATGALLSWLHQGWISAPNGWNLDKARVEVNRDWYSPLWIVTFTIDDPPWWSDSINVEVEDHGSGLLSAAIEGPHFIEDNILCIHRDGDKPEGHWVHTFSTQIP